MNRNQSSINYAAVEMVDQGMVNPECSVWPMLINTAFGVASVRKEWLNVARTLEVSAFKRAFTVILPAAAPTILTGMRISIGIAWLVIVAAEMLVGGTGIGYFVWNEWNNLSLTNVIFAILVIGVVGMLLDLAFGHGHGDGHDRPAVLGDRESRLAVDRECHEFGALGHPGRQVGDEPGDAVGDDGATRRMVVGAAVADGEGVSGEQRDQGIEVAHLCGGQERHGDLPGIVIGGREARPALTHPQPGP